ncbi:MAG: M23 family metallopeptidase [Bacteroidales bacterium]|nr:M23 family metallopeptidase [Bacteroidales bacterium]
MVKRILLFFCLLLSFGYIAAQQKVDFQPPVEGQSFLSGTFGELRAGHFHTGVDIKTDGVEGKRVYSAASGYVARIVVSPTGYGKALYIAHPNGYTTVYGHLQSFRKDIAQYVRDVQFSKKSFAIDISLKPDQFVVGQGDFIALSGNSGGSGGPHLHFEIRETDTEYPVNPLKFNFLNVNDGRCPCINSIAVFPYNAKSFVNGHNKPLFRDVSGDCYNHNLADTSTILVQDKVYFGVRTFDLMDNIKNHNGIYFVKCYFDSDLIFYYQTDSTSFFQGRCVNSIIDYPTYQTKKTRYYKTYFEPNNSSMLLKPTGHDGLVQITDDKVHTVTFVVSDCYDNTSKVEFKIRRDEGEHPVINDDSEYHFKFYESNKLETDYLKVSTDRYALFDNIDFDVYTTNSKDERLLSPVYHIGDKTLASFKKISVSIKLDPAKTNAYKPEQLYVGSETSTGWSPIIGKVADGWINFSVYGFGNFAVMADTEKPSVSCGKLKDDAVADLTGVRQLRVIIKDDKSGISKYIPTFNGDCIIMDYDAINDVMIYVFDSHAVKGTNLLKIEVTDKCGNTTVYERKFLH